MWYRWMTHSVKNKAPHTHSLMKRTRAVHTRTRSRTQAAHAQARLVWWLEEKEESARCRAEELFLIKAHQDRWYKSTGTLRQQRQAEASPPERCKAQFLSAVGLNPSTSPTPKPRKKKTKTKHEKLFQVSFIAVNRLFSYRAACSVKHLNVCCC